MTETPTAKLALPCTKCSSRFEATINTETMAELDRAGVTPQEVLDRIECGSSLGS